MILGSAVPASAQPISGFGCSNPVEDCEDFDGHECGTPQQEECGCFPTVEGPSACIVAECTDLSCDAAEDCPPGYVCIDLAAIDNCSDECTGEGESGLTRLCALLCGAATMTATESTGPLRPFASLR
jgi:hypothetical protein